MAFYWDDEYKGLGKAGAMAQRVRRAAGHIGPRPGLSRLSAFVLGALAGWLAMGALVMYWAAAVG